MKYVVYDTNAILDYNNFYFWATQAHIYFRKHNYKAVLPKQILSELEYHEENQTLNCVGYPYLREGFSLDNLLLGDFQTKWVSREDHQEISYFEKSAEFYSDKLKKKEPLDIVDKDIISLVRKLLDDSKTKNVALLSGDEKLIATCYDILRDDEKREKLNFVNPYQENWFDNIKLENFPFVFSPDIIRQINQVGHLPHFVSASGKKLNLGSKYFSYVNELYSGFRKKPEDIAYHPINTKLKLIDAYNAALSGQNRFVIVDGNNYVLKFKKRLSESQQRRIRGKHTKNITKFKRNIQNYINELTNDNVEYLPILLLPEKHLRILDYYF